MEGLGDTDTEGSLLPSRGACELKDRDDAGEDGNKLQRYAPRRYEDKEEYPEYLAQATRLLRQGGTLVMTWTDKESDPANRDAETRTLREVGRSIRDRDDFVSALLPVGEGLLVAVKR